MGSWDVLWQVKEFHQQLIYLQPIQLMKSTQEQTEVCNITENAMWLKYLSVQQIFWPRVEW